MNTEFLHKATMELGMEDVRDMPLEDGELPMGFDGFSALRETELDNEKMARQGFPGSSAERFRRIGRIGGYMREFASHEVSLWIASGRWIQRVEDGDDLIAATVAHLFETPDAVNHWMYDVFLRDFKENVGVDLGKNHGNAMLVAADPLVPHGFFDDAVALRSLLREPETERLTSITIVDFRVGCILGVAFLGVLGDHVRLDKVTQLAIELEKRIVSIALE